MIDRTNYGVIRERWATGSGLDELVAAFEFKKQALAFLAVLEPGRGRAVSMGYGVVKIERFEHDRNRLGHNNSRARDYTT